MFREIRFYHKYTDAVTAPQWTFCLWGVSFVLPGAFILMYQQLPVYFVASFFISADLLQFLIAREIWRFKKLYRLLRERFWLPY